MVETFGRDGEVADGLYRISGYFCPLAFETLTSPFGNILFHGGPDEFSSYGLACAMYAGMAQVVDHFKDAFSPG